MESDQELLYKMLMEKTGQPKDEIISVCAKDQDMRPNEALKFGLIDSVF